MANRRIYLDLDGVLADWAGAALKLMGMRPDTSTLATFEGVQEAVAAKLYCSVAEADAKLWAAIDATDGRFWRDLEWLPDGMRLLFDCCCLAPTLIVTAPGPHPNSASGKLRWMDKHGDTLRQAMALCPGAETRVKATRLYALCPCKEELAHDGAVLVDDKPSNVARFRSAGGRAVLWPAPWNEHRKLSYEATFALIRREVNGD